MTADRFSRFKNIERHRKDGPGASTNSESVAGFESLEGAAEAPAPSPSPRFSPVEAPPPAPRTLEDARRRIHEPSGLELAEKRHGDQPFVRCVHCQRDSHALARICQFCNSSFDTAEQRAFNEQVWAAESAVRQEPAAPLPIIGDRSGAPLIAATVPVIRSAAQLRAPERPLTEAELETLNAREEQAERGGLHSIFSERQEMRFQLSLATIVLGVLVVVSRIPAIQWPGLLALIAYVLWLRSLDRAER